MLGIAAITMLWHVPYAMGELRVVTAAEVRRARLTTAAIWLAAMAAVVIVAALR